MFECWTISQSLLEIVTAVITQCSGQPLLLCRSGSESDDEDSSSEDSSDDDSDMNSQSKPSSRTYAKPLQDLVGQVVCIDTEDRGKKMVTLPVLVVVPTADDLALPSPNHFLVKSFKDNKL